MKWHAWVVMVSLATLACADDSGADDELGETGESGSGSGDGDGDGDTGDGDTGEAVGECSGWDLLSDFYPDVSFGDLSACSGEQAEAIEASLMNFDGLTITGDSVVGEDGSNTASPCVEVLCDEDYAYIASNALPHYDPQAAPIFDTTETPIVHRIPLVPVAVSSDVSADDWYDAPGCESALGMAVVNMTPTMPPSSHCWYETKDGTANTGEHYVTDGEEVVHKVMCYGQTASLITGIPAFAPCEEARPDPYGSPLFWAYDDPDELFVDYCGTHPAAITHNHWLNEVCLAQDADDKPANSYATGAASFVIEDLDAADCTVESDTLGWAYDGHPLEGGCVCMERDDDGTCTDLRRARSGYVYAGLARWANDASDDANIHTDAVVASHLGVELSSCTTRDDCCDGDTMNCRLYCHPLLVEDAGEVALEQRCVTPDYSWCGHEFVEHDDVLEDDGYVYLDRCNGVETADGYVYAGTPTFPYVNGCYKDDPSEMAIDDTYTRLDMDMGGMGGGPPP
ncbi:hypothetical protein ENSA5_67600 [Enhygromyxa salina]|uniref:Uncharacterized protein n=1 Tax=Enhygromyxa salina TaxID=215803 RepID=A0A2S9XBA9_9BACT|nr:YHYH protein [Enhygromyxa salina]PRP90142.1 hypothetical protein ENSA5_67600 [Enhygromyxa salina]